MLLQRRARRLLGAGEGEPAPSEVTQDNFTGLARNTSTTPWAAVAHTLGASADYLLVGVSWEQNVTVTVTAGGIAMVSVGTAGPVASGLTRVQLFRLDASGDFPDPGSVNVVVTPSGNGAGYVGVWSLNGAVPGAPNRTDPVTATNGNAAPALADVPAGAFVASVVNSNRGAGTVLSVTGEDTEDFLDNTGNAAGGQAGGFASNLPSEEETVTHSWADTNTSRIAALMAEILPA